MQFNLFKLKNNNNWFNQTGLEINIMKMALMKMTTVVVEISSRCTLSTNIKFDSQERR